MSSRLWFDTGYRPGGPTHPYADRLGTKHGMLRAKHDGALRLPGLYPDRAGPADEGKRVLAHYLSRPLERQFDSAGGERARGAELVRDAQHHPRGIDTIAEQFRVVGFDAELLTHAFRREDTRDHDSVAEVPVDTRVVPDPPPRGGAAQFREEERRVRQVTEALAVGFDLRPKPVADVDPESIAVRENDALTLACVVGPVADRPVKARLEHNLLLRVALRPVEAGGRLGNAENIRHAVVADSVARAEVGVRVVVEGAPADPARKPIVYPENVVHAGVAQRVLLRPLRIVGALGREHVPDELRVQVEGVARRRDEVGVEIVNAEDVFEQLRVEEVADAARLAGIVQRVGDPVGPRVEYVIILRLVDPHAPENDRRVVPVPPDHRLYVPAGELFPALVADMLPTGDLLEDQEAYFVAAVQEVC